MELNPKGILLVVSGPSGCGKGTVLSHILSDKKHYSLSVSLTTRLPRYNEIDGVHYRFVSEEEFQKNIASGNLLEYTKYSENYYGTPEDQVEKILNQGINVVLEIETEGALNIKRLRPDAVLVMILPPSYKILEQRLRNRRTNSEEDIQRRLIRAKEELSFLPEYDYAVLNPDGGDKEAAETIAAIVETRRHEISRNPHLLDHFYLR